MGSAIAGIADLHAPHLPVSARCFAGIRFAFPHDEQFRMMAIMISLIKLALEKSAHETLTEPRKSSSALRV
jgi:hypothetical protein